MVTVAALVCVLGGCHGAPEESEPYRVHVNGDPGRGRQVIADVGCGACHVIPGIRPAVGLVGPPLLWWSRRTYIAGELPNTPDNLVRWMRSPKSIQPRTAMPAVGLDEQQARDVAAYLYTLR